MPIRLRSDTCAPDGRKVEPREQNPPRDALILHPGGLRRISMRASVFTSHSGE
jgi:hypothetical protein